MKLLRLGEIGKEKPAVLLRDGVALDVQSHVRDFDGPFFETGGLQELSRAVARGGLREVKLDGIRVGAPIARPWTARPAEDQLSPQTPVALPVSERFRP